MTKEQFLIELEKLNIKLEQKQIEQLDKFYVMMVEWNKKINLTSILEEKEVYLKHFYDSLTLVKLIDFTKNIEVCDVGTGAGFPGIVLKIVFPNIKMKLIDSLNKRIIYLNEVIKELNLKNIEALHYRMEEYSKLNEEKFDYIVSRAVSNIKVITEISIKSLKINGNIILMKAKAEEELQNIEKELNKLNAKLKDIVEFKLPIENSNRTLIKIEKISKTPKQYPEDLIKLNNKQ